MSFPIILAAIIAGNAIAAGNDTEPRRGVVMGPIASLEGNLWEEGGLDPPFVAGDELQVVGVVGQVKSDIDIPWEPESYSYTFWAHSMIAEDEVISGSTRRIFSGGEFAIFREPLPSNHEYGINPPNETSPSTFSDGELFLGGEIAVSEILFDGTSIPRYLHLYALQYTSGTALDVVLAQCGVCTGEISVTVDQDAPALPEGYDLGFSGTFQNYFVTSVEAQSWGRLKAAYR